jgi:hypothetical protein
MGMNIVARRPSVLVTLVVILVPMVAVVVTMMVVSVVIRWCSKLHTLIVLIGSTVRENSFIGSAVAH